MTISDNDVESVLVFYKVILENNKTSLEIKLASTLWLQQMLNYQVNIFKLYFALRLKREGKIVNEKFIILMQNIDLVLMKQVEKNKEFIDITLIDKSEKLFISPIKKIEIKELAFK